MAETKIEWADYTWNPWRGCTKVSAGCDHCYAETMSGRNPKVLGEWGPAGVRVMAADRYMELPYKWNDVARADRRRRTVFCASLADVFEQWPGTMTRHTGEPSSATMHDMRAMLCETIKLTPWLYWLLLTKRPENVEIHLGRCGHPYLLEMVNVGLGVSVENQDVDERIEIARNTGARMIWLSVEPMLGVLDILQHGDVIEWVIVGGESGHGARPMHPTWVRDVKRQCRLRDIPFFFKQWGEYAPANSFKAKMKIDQQFYAIGMEASGVIHQEIQDGDTWLYRVGKHTAGRLLDGKQYTEYPKRIQQHLPVL